jgi:hypothetical protein
VNLDQAKHLCEEAYELSRILSDMYMSKALPMARQGALVGTKETNRLYRISEKARQRWERRCSNRDDLIWPRRIEIRANLAKLAEKKAKRNRK